ncbi:MAG: hypothetical protein Q4A56_08315 [Porphyromonadaceae bacterium]|nr:hypothetical protein [Porphyromonadaceae bacterium]
MKNIFVFSIFAVIAILFNNLNAQTVEYGLYIGNLQVTSENASNITSNDIHGYVSYDAHTKTLTLNEADIDVLETIAGINNEKIDGLVINLIGENTISSSNNGGIILHKNTEIRGNGSLKISSESFTGIIIKNSTTLKVTDCSIAINGAKCGIAGISGTAGETLTVNNATIRATGKEEGSLNYLADIKLTDCIIKEPEEALFDSSVHAVVHNGNIVKTRITIDKDNGIPIPYGLKIADIEINAANASDIAATSPNITGSVSYDHSTKTLTLNNAYINVSELIEGINNQSIDGLIINILGDNTISASDNCGIVLYKNTEIKGSGLLSVSSEMHAGITIYMNTTLTVNEGCTVKTKGRYGITGIYGTNNETLVVNNAIVKATGSQEGSIVYLANLKLTGCNIVKPASAVFDSLQKAVCINQTIVKEQVVIQKELDTFIPVISDYKDFNIWSSDGILHIQLTDFVENRKLILYDVLGRVTGIFNLTEAAMGIPLSKGVYIVKIDNIVEKVVVE